MTTARLPASVHSPLLRTDFTDDEAWGALVAEVGSDWLTVMADPGHRGLSVSELMALVPDDSRYPVLAVADDVTFSGKEQTLLLVDLRDEPGRTFRAVPDAFRSAVANLAIGNQSFEDQLIFLDRFGVYRLPEGFHQAVAELKAAFLPPGGHPGAKIAGPRVSRSPARSTKPGRAGAPKKPGIPPNS